MIITTYKSNSNKSPRSLEKKMLDKALTACYTKEVIIEKEKK